MKPEHITIRVLREHAPVLSLHSIFRQAKLHPSTMRARMRRGTPEIKKEEAIAIIEVLERYGVYLSIVHHHTP